MLKYTIVTKELHYDNCDECIINMAQYKAHGFKVISCASEYDWYFVAEKKIKK